MSDIPLPEKSDALTLLNCYRIQLTDLHPTGEWMLHVLYQRYRERPYGGLTNGEMYQLLIYLQSEVSGLTPDLYRDWYTRHQQAQEDAQATEDLPSMD